MQPKKNGISKIGIIVLSISLSLLLLSGEIFHISIIKNEVYAQQNPNPGQIISQILPFIEVISINITTHNNPNIDPDPDPDKIEQIVEGIGTEIGEISDSMAIQAMSEIASEVDLDPKGPLAHSLIALSAQLTPGNRLTDIINNILQTGENIVDGIINEAYALVLGVAEGKDIEKALDESGSTSNLIPSSFSPKSYGGALFFTASSISATQVTTFVHAQQQQSSQQHTTLTTPTTPPPPPTTTTPPPPPTITDSLSLDAVKKVAGYMSQVTGSDDLQVERTLKGILVTAFNKGLKEPEPLRNQIKNLVDQVVIPNSPVQKVIADIAEKKESKESSKIEIANKVI
jgi:hypothetical protein